MSGQSVVKQLEQARTRVVPTRTQEHRFRRRRRACSSSRQRAHKLRHSRRPSRAAKTHRLPRSQHLIVQAPKPTNISRHHHLCFSVLLIFLPPIHYTTHTLHPCHPCPYTSPNIPTRSLSTQTSPPARARHTRPSCDSTTLRLTAPTLPLQHITSFITTTDHLPSLPVALHRRASIHRRRTLLIDRPSIKPSNHPSSNPGSTTAIGHRETTTLVTAANDRRNTTHARIELAKSVENHIVDAPTRSAPTR